MYHIVLCVPGTPVMEGEGQSFSTELSIFYSSTHTLFLPTKMVLVSVYKHNKNKTINPCRVPRGNESFRVLFAEQNLLLLLMMLLVYLPRTHTHKYVCFF